VAAPVKLMDEGARLTALLYRGRQAFDAGHVDLAVRAADGALAIDPRSEDAWLLKADSEPDVRSRALLLRMALTINPGATRIAEHLSDLEEDAPARPASTRNGEAPRGAGESTAGEGASGGARH
jgi:hypothetical protein